MTHCPTLLEQLRQRGYRITPQREMIIQALAQVGDHATAEEIYAQVKDRSSAVNIATIYRTLDTLAVEGLICRTNLWNGQAVYVTSQHGPHLHLVCRLCGSIHSVEPDLVQPLADQLKAEYHFSAELQHMSIVGLCAACQAEISKREENR
jgi:Fur family transcriptional regulator, ferric uptake regulator